MLSTKHAPIMHQYEQNHSHLHPHNCFRLHSHLNLHSNRHVHNPLRYQLPTVSLHKRQQLIIHSDLGNVDLEGR